MEIDKDKLLACWQKWNIHKAAFTPSVRLLKEKRFEFNRERYCYELFEIPKGDKATVYDFISECLYIVNGYVWDETFLKDEETTKLVCLPTDEFWKNIAYVFNRGSLSIVESELKEILEPEKAIAILLISQCWDWSTYILEYDDKYKFVSIDMLW